MIRGLAVLVAVLALAATPAQAASSAAERAAALEQQVKTLQRQVKTLQKDSAALKKRIATDERALLANFAADACQTALVADAVQSTWLALNALAGRELVAVGAPLDDRRACTALQIRRAPPSAAPTVVGLFGALIDWLL